MTVIHKKTDDWRVIPNFIDYEKTRASFDWSTAPDPCVGMGAGSCNIALRPLPDPVRYVTQCQTPTRS